MTWVLPFAFTVLNSIVPIFNTHATFGETPNDLIKDWTILLEKWRIGTCDVLIVELGGALVGT